MKWFKHMSDTRTQELGSWIVDKFGMDWYGRFWVILETIAQSVTDTDDFSCTLSSYDWCTKLKCKQKQLLTFLLEVAYKSDIKHFINENQIRIEYPKMRNYRDNHTNNVKSSKSTCKLLASIEEDKDIEEDIEEDKKENKIKEKNLQGRTFKNPSLKEIQDFILENSCSVNAETFFNYYESNGWKVGRNSMKDWKATIRTWQAKDGKKALIQKFGKQSVDSMDVFRKFNEEMQAEAERGKNVRLQIVQSGDG